MMDEQLTARLQEALQRTDIMALSTVDADGGSWTSPVQFHYDQQLRLSFLSLPDARHVKNINRDPRVSAAIYNHPGPPGGNLELQLRGTAEREGEAAGWERFLVTIDELWCFDSRTDRQRRRIDISELQL